MTEKTEKPTSHKLRKEKQRGNAAKSVELASAILLLGAFLILWSLSSLLNKRFKEVFTVTYANPNLEGAFTRAFSPILFPVVGILIGILCLAIATNLFQTGWIWRTKQPGRKKGKPRFIYPLLKLIVVGLIGYFVLRSFQPSSELVFSTSNEKQVYLFKQIFYLLVIVSIALVLLGFCDFFYQKWKFYKHMHMTKQEFKEEKREIEGDRETKAKMRNRK